MNSVIQKVQKPLTERHLELIKREEAAFGIGAIDEYYENIAGILAKEIARNKHDEDALLLGGTLASLLAAMNVIRETRALLSLKDKELEAMPGKGCIFTKEQYANYVQLLQKSDVEQDLFLEAHGFQKQDAANYPDHSASEIWSPLPKGLGYSRGHALLSAFRSALKEKGEEG